MHAHKSVIFFLNFTPCLSCIEIFRFCSKVCPLTNLTFIIYVITIITIILYLYMYVNHHHHHHQGTESLVFSTEQSPSLSLPLSFSNSVTLHSITCSFNQTSPFQRLAFFQKVLQKFNFHFTGNKTYFLYSHQPVNYF